MSVRVRFAPSPTGMLHIGALRTVLFDHLFARKHGGRNILRIEDTDRARYNADSEKEFVETLHWVGIDFDEGPHVGGPFGPYRQSERKDQGIYDEHIRRLLELGHAYKAFETPEELEQMREYQQLNKLSTGYFGGEWRDADPGKIDQAEAAGLPYVVRQRIPRDQKIVTQDAIRGRIEFDSNLLPDPVLIKADGMPTYHFAAMVDDRLMEITHVFRGEEWISTFPSHWLLFEQFGWERPVFVHCPVIVGNDGKKLSKRHGATRVLDYAAQGYHRDAIKNFIALIGWSPRDEREVMSEAELIDAFSLEGLQPSPGKFDLEKLKWLNGHRIRLMDPEILLDDLVAYVRMTYTREFWLNFVDENPMPNQKPVDGPALYAKLQRIADVAETDRPYVLAALKEVQERVQTLADFGDAIDFFLVDQPDMDEKAAAKWLGQPHVAELIDWTLAKLQDSHVETVEHYETILRGFQTHKGLEKLGPVVHPMRVMLTGKTQGPGLFELMSVLGHDRIVARLQRARGLASA
ncbi:MAG TPA: glutamate--tRNA ligase [Fimbriimonas sp.]